jgi:hypothetical protein
MKRLKIARIICAAIFIAGIPSLIISSIIDNNGAVLTFGLITATTAVVLVAISTVTATERIDVFDDALAERVEQRVAELVAAGADEEKVRSLVRESIELARGPK